ncbi:MAG: hypothetical protein R3D27_09305 [Hyphomicrobiaceae bacterium]
MNKLPDSAAHPQSALLDDLRRRIRTLEQMQTIGRAPARRWLFGIDAIDDLIAPADRAGLDTAALHEVKPAADAAAPAASCRAAALGFALALAARLDAGDTPAAPILWCTARTHAHETGHCHGPGLAAFGIDPARLIVVEAGRADEVLWALEEGVSSGAVALVVGLLDTVPATPARRLTLATAAHATPCLVITHPARPAATTAATRWRVAPAPSAPHPFAASSPGAPRLAVHLERCRARPLALAERTIHMEWCDATFRFRVAAGPGDRAARPRLAATRAG